MKLKYRSNLFTLCAMVLSISSFVRPQADELELLWQQAPDIGVPYLSVDLNSERGVAYNPATGHLLVASRASSTGDIYILNAETGELIGNLSLGTEGIVTGGTFALSEIEVTADGVIYAANLTTSTATPNFRVYRWENETADPTLAYEGDPSGDASAPRWGDSFDVRGTGTNTQFVAGAGSGATLGAVFTTTDGLTFTPTKITNISANEITFGKGNSVWAMRSGGTLRVIEFNLATGVGTVRQTIASTQIPTTVIPIKVNVESNLFAGISINTATDDVRLYDISNTNSIMIVDQELFPANNPNANAVGAVELYNDLLFAVNANNGLVAYRILKTVSPPVFQSQPPATITVLEGGPLTLTANVSGTAPITFTWQLEGTNVPGGGNATLTITNISADNAGTYTLIASNSAQSVTSNPVVVTVQDVVNTQVADLLWRRAPGQLPFLGISNLERGIAYNALSNHVVVVSRADGVKLHVIDGDTGAYLWEMQTPTSIITNTASTPGGFRLNMVGVADDGAVYAANLTTGAGEGDATAFRIYRWENTSSNAAPVQVYRGAPVAGRRFGDTFDVRGAGNDTQILLGNNVAAAEPDNTTVIMTTADAGATFTPNVIVTPGVDDDFFRLGIAFGNTNTFWGKTSGQQLHLVQFDLSTGTGTLLQTFTNVPLSGVSVSAQSNLVAVITLENPDSVRFYELNAAGDTLTLVDQEIYLVKNANANGTGSIDFAGDRVYALDTNNGILAMELSGEGDPQPAAPTFGAVSGSANSLTFSLTGTPGATYQIEATNDFQGWIDVQTVTIEGDGSNSVTIDNNGSYRFYRAVAE
ncbi:MAG TPA: immunoglobulin domain-containing protein [Verrucomicrobiae bacterium]